MSSLNGAEIIRGDSYTATITFTNQGDLVGAHPLKIAGFQTPGYSARFTAKTKILLPDTSAAITKTDQDGIDIVSETEAILTLTPSDTKSLKIGDSGLVLNYDFQFADDTNTYTMERGSFTVTLDVSVTAP